jgi:hypothetical protein
MAILAFGVIIGSVTGPIAQSAGITPVLVEEPAETGATPPAAGPEAGFAATPPPPPAQLPAPLSIAASPPLEGPAPAAPPPSLPPELPPEEVLPPITHVFLIVLGDHGFEEAFGPESPAPYLSEKLRGEGELLPNYYAVTQGALANQIALLSGQGPTPQTAADCPEYADLIAGEVAPAGQVEGSGCVYPAEALTLPGQIAAAGGTWKAYVEGMADGAPPGSESCRRPPPGGPDQQHDALPDNPYQTWRNPFVYFHSLTDGPECAERDVDLEQLAPDLSSAKTTPTLSYLVPNACHAGDGGPCVDGQPTGLAASQAFLESVVPQIIASSAYQQGGLIAITSAQAPQAGPETDSSACCATPAYPNLPPPPETPPAPGPVQPSGGGGRVGLLLISPFVEPGSTEEAGYYNHFTLLRSIEELLGLSPLGYAAELSVTPFDSSVYNAAP